MGNLESPTIAEKAIDRARRGVLAPQALLWTLAASKVVVPTPDGDFSGDPRTFVPLLIGRDSMQFLVVFTRPVLIGSYASRAPQFIEMLGGDIVTGMPPGVGIVINPGTDEGFELPPDGVAAFRDELA